jgi:hypothetical protein
MSERRPIEYRPDAVPTGRDPESTWQRFVAGVAIGTAVSAVVWIGGAASGRFVPARMLFAVAYIVVPGMKLVIGASLLSQPPWRSFGAGLLVSLGVGLLILCGLCAAQMTAQ